MEVAVASYNTSVFGAKLAKDKVRINQGSEARFLALRPDVVDPNREGMSMDNPEYTYFFDNALTHLKKTVDKKEVKVIGIQEYEPRTEGDFILKFPSATWAMHIHPGAGKFKASLLTIWDREKFGEALVVYDADLPQVKDPGEVGGVKLEGRDEGRPISIIKTTKGYFLMNFHGINRAKYNSSDGTESGVDVSALLKKLIQLHVTEAAKYDITIDANRLIIMCDSNDREHGINSESPLIINGNAFHDGRIKNNGAISGCYNWDSCGFNTPPPGAGEMTGPTVISMGDPSLRAEVVATGRVPEGKNAGCEEMYAFPGDYVLGLDPLSLEAIDSPQDSAGASVASDHKLVIGKLRLGAAAAGGRRKRRHTKRRIPRKQRKTRSGKRKSKRA